MYVSNTGRFAGIISVFDTDGNCINKLGHLNPFKPHGMGLCSSGFIYVSSTPSDVVVMDKTGTHIRSMPVGSCSGQIAVDAQGKVCTIACEHIYNGTTQGITRWSIKITTSI
jgi:hypothetical protein